jgi:hypothetical protein
LVKSSLRGWNWGLRQGHVQRSPCLSNLPFQDRGSPRLKTAQRTTMMQSTLFPSQRHTNPASYTTQPASAPRSTTSIRILRIASPIRSTCQWSRHSYWTGDRILPSCRPTPCACSQSPSLSHLASLHSMESMLHYRPLVNIQLFNNASLFCRLATGAGPYGIFRTYSYLCETVAVAMPKLYLSTLRVGNDTGHGCDVKLAQILATLDAFGLQARGSSSWTGALGPADSPDRAPASSWTFRVRAGVRGFWPGRGLIAARRSLPGLDDSHRAWHGDGRGREGMGGRSWGVVTRDRP